MREHFTFFFFFSSCLNDCRQTLNCESTGGIMKQHMYAIPQADFARFNGVPLKMSFCLCLNKALQGECC